MRRAGTLGASGAGTRRGRVQGRGVGGAPPPRAQRASCGVVTAQARRVPAAFAASARRRLWGPRAPACARSRGPAAPASPAARLSRKMTLKASEGEGGGGMRTALSDLYLEHLLQKHNRPEVSGSRGPPNGVR